MGSKISYLAEKRGFEEREEHLSEFNLLPREIKEMILGRVAEDTANFFDFKNFWRLRLVNKEFYSILNSKHVRRFSVKCPCWILFRQHHIENVASMVVRFPIDFTRKYRNFEIVLDDSYASYSQFEKKELEMDWKDVPGYFRERPFRIDLVVIEPYISTAHMIPALRELANQTSETLQVKIMFLHLDQVEQLNLRSYAHAYHFGFYREEFLQNVLNELKDIVKAGKINIGFDSEY
ncbi:unnamed protein product [Auanema sp. JU1783]|nr:unnamed protein product [Auanema sp. JU1783]